MVYLAWPALEPKLANGRAGSISCIGSNSSIHDCPAASEIRGGIRFLSGFCPEAERLPQTRNGPDLRNQNKALNFETYQGARQG